MKLLIFDIDGTLINVGEAEAIAFQTALKEHYSIENVDTNWDIYENRTDTGIVYEILNEHLGHPPSKNQIFEILDTYVTLLEKEFSCRKRPGKETAGTSQFLRALHSRQEFMMTIATGNIKKAAQLKLSWFKMAQYFIGGGFADDAYKRLDILRAAIERANSVNRVPFGKENAFFIGDNLSDFFSARALGIRFIGICNSKKKANQFSSEGVKIIFPNFMKKANIIEVILS